MLFQINCKIIVAIINVERGGTVTLQHPLSSYIIYYIIFLGMWKEKTLLCLCKMTHFCIHFLL